MTQVDNILQDIDKEENGQIEEEKGEKVNTTNSEDEEEGDDVMNSDEYKKLLQKRTANIRFSILSTASKRPVDRRMTMFNPSDPNNSAASFKFLVKDPSKITL